MKRRLPALAFAVVCELAVLYGFVAEFGCNGSYDARRPFVCGDSPASVYEIVLAAAALVAAAAVIRPSTRVAAGCVAAVAATLAWGLRTVPA